MDPTARHTQWQQRLRPLLSIPGAAYAAVMHVRRLAYAKGILTAWRPPAPCIAVGNIGWGGSGKTPLSGWLLDWLVNKDLHPVLLSRGYKATPPRLPFPVSPDSLPEDAGDEPLMLARSCPGASVVVDPVRSRAGRWAVEHLAPDVFILDDAMQHLAVKRDCNLVLLKPEDLALNWNRVIPSGPWREGASALNAASAFCFNCTPEHFKTLYRDIEQRLAAFSRPVFSFHLSIADFLDCNGNRGQDLKDHHYCLVTGIADPEKALQTVTSALGTPPLRHLVFPDHHPYDRGDWERIERNADTAGCRTVLCTPKDFVKLSRLADDRLQTFDLNLAFGPFQFSGQSFPDWIASKWNEISRM